MEKNKIKENKNFNIEKFKIMIGGVLIGSFIWVGLDLYKFKSPLFFYIIGISIFLTIGRFKLVNFISEIYYSLISREFENLLIIILLILNFRKIYLNNLFYTLLSFLTFNTLLFLLKENIFLKEKTVDKTNKKSLLSFREKELQYLKKLIKDPLVSTILIDDKIGNGKTFLLEAFLEDQKEDLEIIYLKLPLIKNQDTLIKIVNSEIYKILRKNKIYLKKRDLFFKYLNGFKISFFEFKYNCDQTNWESIEELKKGIEDSNKQILIILDDIEREDNYKKIKKSISFLGEFSEYLRDTRTTFLFVAQQDRINKLKDFNDINNFDFKEINFFEKYFNQVIKLSPLRFKELKYEDLEILINQNLEPLLKEWLENKDEDIEEKTSKNRILHTKFILELLRSLEENGLNLKIPIDNEKFRVLSMFLVYFKESILAEPLNNNSYLVWMYIYKSFELFFNNLSIKIINQTKIDSKIYTSLKMNLEKEINFTYSSDSEENKIKIQKLYQQGGLREENNFLNIENILNYLDSQDEKIKERIKIKVDSSNAYYLFENINKKNINIFLNLQLEFDSPVSENLIRLINKIGTFKGVSEAEIKIYFKYLIKEIKNKTFYCLFYEGHSFKDENGEIIYVDDLSNDTKIKNLKFFKDIILQDEEQIKKTENIAPILSVIDNHINDPSINSDDIDNYR
ncbi:MAG: hypothetical protein ACRC1R_07935 [Cetobacterium sp.]|uniref:hypothetical protein n=1 Tax=Cetobacterium sp. TaxID=2071632 RepID=UPI003EE5571C